MPPGPTRTEGSIPGLASARLGRHTLKTATLRPSQAGPLHRRDLGEEPVTPDLVGEQDRLQENLSPMSNQVTLCD